MSYNYSNQYQPYRPYTQAPQVWQPQMQQSWQAPAQQPVQPMWQPSVQEQTVPEPTPESREDPVVAAIRELTAEIAALRKTMTPRATKKREVEEE